MGGCLAAMMSTSGSRYDLKAFIYTSVAGLDVPEFPQLEFDTFMTVQKVKTKGRADHASWVVKYKVLFSFDGTNWRTYQEPYGTDKVRR